MDGAQWAAKMKGAGRQAFLDLRRAAFDERRTKFLLTELGLETAWRDMRVRRKDENPEGRWAPGLDDFVAAFPEFPVALVAHDLHGLPLHRDRNSTLVRLMKDVRATPLYRAYLEAYELRRSSCPGRPVGMVFPRQGMVQGMVLHNGPPDLSGHGSRVLLYAGGRNHLTLVMEGFAGFVRGVHAGGRGWCGSWE